MCVKDKRVVLGFSGGMDSLTAATLLRDGGWQVVAVTLDTIGDEPMLQRARQEAARLGVEHIVLDVRREFTSRIIDYFVDSYASGRTPAPCTLCNTTVKWHFLAKVADDLGIEHIATGHYFNVVESGQKLYVARAKDTAKDQSYYLWGLRQDLLRRIITPMGSVIKSEIRDNFRDRRESMGICFLQGEGYREFLCRRIPSLAQKGDVVNNLGEVVGSHDGTAFYTIGQKRGFTLFSSASAYSVVLIDAARNELQVGEECDLLKLTLEIDECNIVDDNELLSSDDISVVVRGVGRNPEGYARLVEPTDYGYRITLHHSAWAAAVGQPVVLYRQNRVIGGGFLRNSF